MKYVIESIEELYKAREPTGHVIVDAVVNVLRQTRVIRVTDMALLLEADLRELQCSWHLMTGTHLQDVIAQWRLYQAQELIRTRLVEWGEEACKGVCANRLLTDVARRCGWRSQRVMSKVFERYCSCSALEWMGKPHPNPPQ